MKTIDEINFIVNGNYKVTEKQAMLYQLRKELNEKIDEAIEEVKNGYKYCSKCGEYYKEKAWETEHRTEMRKVCTFHSLVEFDDDIYEDKMCSVTYEICPMGHVFEEEITWQEKMESKTQKTSTSNFDKGVQSFRLEVDIGSGGYGFTDSFNELLVDVEREYGEEIREEVKEWALQSKYGDEFHKYGMYVTNLGQ